MGKTLVALLTAGRPDFERSLAETANVKEAVVEARSHLDRLQQSYQQELTVHQVPIAAMLLQAVRDTVGSLMATRAEVWQQALAETTGTKAEIVDYVPIAAKAVQALLCAGLLLSLSYTSAWLAFALTILIVGAEAYLLIYAVARRRQSRVNPSFESISEGCPSSIAVAKVDPATFVDCLLNALAEVDRAVGAVLEPTPPPLPDERIEHLFPKVIDLFHELLSSSQLGDDAELRKLAGRRVPQVLREQ